MICITPFQGFLDGFGGYHRAAPCADVFRHFRAALIPKIARMKETMPGDGVLRPFRAFRRDCCECHRAAPCADMSRPFRAVLIPKMFSIWTIIFEGNGLSRSLIGRIIFD